MTLNDPRIQRLITLIKAALTAPPGKGRIALAVTMGALCHLIFAIAVLSMMAAMFFGMSESFGTVPWPWAILANAALIVQFTLVHSFLLSKRGTKIVSRMVARWPPPPTQSSPRCNSAPCSCSGPPAASSGTAPKAPPLP